ncbi:hypothetical protein ZIOFF_021560 [Zingiber officinale]|uniref:Nucleotide-diphospho-sugar transferase domain-containing protein n=1 Tax=Zingiber officinale TaxID=94328 RepID=A0A8J5H1M5_ZINOF|nr:hypothetical protein ZIOFF_021560 [Zingiber officinale]
MRLLHFLVAAEARESIPPTSEQTPPHYPPPPDHHRRHQKGSTRSWRRRRDGVVSVGPLQRDQSPTTYRSSTHLSLSLSLSLSLCLSIYTPHSYKLWLVGDPVAEKNDVKLEKVLKEAAMENKTEMEHARRLLDHLVIIALDKKAYIRCISLHTHYFALYTEGMDFSDEKIYMTAGYLSMMWRRIEFLRVILEMGYNFIFSDSHWNWSSLRPLIFFFGSWTEAKNPSRSCGPVLLYRALAVVEVSLWFGWAVISFSVDHCYRQEDVSVVRQL